MPDGQELAYPWATSVRVDRQGDLRVLQGLRQRAFHSCAEWASYTVKNLALWPGDAMTHRPDSGAAGREKPR
jgi:hypothetical protein